MANNFRKVSLLVVLFFCFSHPLAFGQPQYPYEQGAGGDFEVIDSSSRGSEADRVAGQDGGDVQAGGDYVYPTTCGRYGDQCGGPCGEGQYCREVAVSARQEGPRVRPGNDGDGGVTTPGETRCECGPITENLCIDCDPGAGMRCAGPCAPHSSGEGRLCVERQIGTKKACQCRTNQNTCEVDVDDDGRVVCTGACSNGGCVLKDEDTDDPKCECGNSCRIGVSDQGQIVCQGACQNGGACVLDQDQKSCGCATPQNCQEIGARDYNDSFFLGCEENEDNCEGAFRDCTEKLIDACTAWGGEITDGPTKVGDCTEGDDPGLPDLPPLPDELGGGILQLLGDVADGVGKKCWQQCKATCCKPAS